MKKQSTYIFLPTDKASEIYLNLKTGAASLNKISPYVNDGYSTQYLYILSDDEPKEGDWVENNGKVAKLVYLKAKLDGDRKIIATTNPELHIKLRPKTKDDWHNDDFINDVANISTSEIQYIIDLHNGKGKGVDVEKLTSEYIAGEVLNGLENVPLIHLDKAYKAAYNQCLQDNANNIQQILEWIEDQKKHDADEERYVSIKEFIESLNQEKPKDMVIVVYKKGIDNEIYTPLIHDGCILITRG